MGVLLVVVLFLLQSCLWLPFAAQEASPTLKVSSSESLDIHFLSPPSAHTLSVSEADLEPLIGTAGCEIASMVVTLNITHNNEGYTNVEFGRIDKDEIYLMKHNGHVCYFEEVTCPRCLGAKVCPDYEQVNQYYEFADDFQESVSSLNRAYNVRTTETYQFKPFDSLAKFSGKSCKGNYTIQVKNTRSFGGTTYLKDGEEVSYSIAGVLNSWSLELSIKKLDPQTTTATATATAFDPILLVVGVLGLGCVICAILCYEGYEGNRNLCLGCVICAVVLCEGSEGNRNRDSYKWTENPSTGHPADSTEVSATFSKMADETNPIKAKDVVVSGVAAPSADETNPIKANDVVVSGVEAPSDVASKLQQLVELLEQGHLTQAEFAAAKAAVLSGDGRVALADIPVAITVDYATAEEK